MLVSEEQHILKTLAKKEGWELDTNELDQTVIIANQKKFALTHPYEIHLRLYRSEKDPDLKYHSMRRIHDILWPDHILTYNDWTEMRFRAHCDPNNSIVLSGGASAGKSVDCAKIGLIFYLSDPKHNAVIVASTTLESLESRIWGYVMKLFANASLPISGRVLTSKPPKIIYPGQKDKIHGMFATAVRMGDDDMVVSTIIGRHPDKGLMVILDESTDMNPAITKAIPNLEQGVDFFQLWAIGNSNSKFDLHGALATPKNGWDSVDPMRDDVWVTNQKNGICLYFNPYKSPAILEQDPVKKAALSRFLITEEGIEEKKRLYGENSASFYRFVLGFWPKQSVDNTIVTEQFIIENRLMNNARWSQFNDLQVVAGLDPEFQVGGTGCVLRLAIFGQMTDGTMALDFRENEMLHRIDIQANKEKSAEIQIAEDVLKHLREYGCPVSNMAIDATGVGRALGSVIHLVSGESNPPYRIMSTKRKDGNSQNGDPFVQVMTPIDIWLKFKEFAQHSQIRGLDLKTTQQLVSRLVIQKNGKLTLETKKDYRSRMAIINPALAHSPDESDSMMLGIIAAIFKFGFFPGMKRDVPYQGEVSKFQYEKEQAHLLERKAEQYEAVIARPQLNASFSAPLEELVQKPKSLF